MIPKNLNQAFLKAGKEPGWDLRGPTRTSPQPTRYHNGMLLLVIPWKLSVTTIGKSIPSDPLVFNYVNHIINYIINHIINHQLTSQQYVLYRYVDSY